MMRAALLLSLAAALGCSGASVYCRPTFEYQIVIDVSTAPRAACQVELRAGTTVAAYSFAALPEPDSGQCSSRDAQPACTPLDGSPQPTWCQASVCLINISFGPDIARDLSTFMGADDFRMLVTCDGAVVVDRVVQPLRQVCFA